VVSPRLVSEAALVPSKGSPRVICGGPSGTMTNLLIVPRLSPSVSFHNFFILKQYHSYQRGKRATSGNLQIQQCSFGIGEHRTKSYFMVFFLDFKELYRVVSKTTSLSIITLKDKVRNPISLNSLSNPALSSKTKLPDRREYYFLLRYFI